MQNFFSRMVRFRIPILIVIAVLTVFFLVTAIWFPGLKFDTDLRSLIPEAIKADRLVKDRPNTDYLVVAVEKSEKEGASELFSKETLTQLQHAIKEINEIPNLRVAISPFEQIKIRPSFSKNHDWSYEVSTILKKDTKAEVLYPFENEESVAQFKEDLLSLSISKRLVIDDSGEMLAFMIDHREYASTMELPDTIIALLDRYSDYFSYSLAGIAYFEKFVADFLLSDLFILLGLGVLLSLLLFWVSFRSLKAVVFPVLVIIIGTIWMLGAMALTNIQLSVISIVCPPLVLALSSSYCIHIFNQYYRGAKGVEVKKDPAMVFSTISEISPTIIMASITTIIAMFGLFVTKITQMRFFAVSISLGIFFSSALALCMLPALLSFFPMPTEKLNKQSTSPSSKKIRFQRKLASERWLSQFLLKLGDWIFIYRYLLLVLFAIILFSPFVSKKYMSYDSDYISYFPEDNIAYQQSAKISRRLSGIVHLYIDYQIDQNKLKQYAKEQGWDQEQLEDHSNFYKNEECLKIIADFEEQLKRHENVRYLVSFPLLLSEINEKVTGEYKIPDELSQRLKLDMIFKVLRVQKNSQLDMISARADRITTTFRMADLNNPNSSHGYVTEENMKIWADELNAQLAQIAPPYLNVVLDGSRIDFLALRKQMDKDLNYSTIVSVLLILFTVALVFRNFGLGLISLIPLSSGLTLNLTLMALFRIPMDMTTIMVSCVVVGIGVDDSIHFLLRFTHLYATYKGEKNRLIRSISETMEATGRPIVLTSISIIVCMGMMLFATFTPIAYFGGLIALALLTTTIGTLLFLPMALALYYHVVERFSLSDKIGLLKKEQTSKKKK